MNIFKLGLVISGLGLLTSLLLFSLLFFIPNMKHLLGDSPGMIPLIGVAIFVVGTLSLSMSHGDKLSHWGSALMILSLLFLFIPWEGDYTPQNTALALYSLFIVSSVCSWLYLIYLYKTSSNHHNNHMGRTIGAIILVLVGVFFAFFPHSIRVFHVGLGIVALIVGGWMFLKAKK